MLCLRLQRTGSRNTPTYRLVLIAKRAAAKGKPKEILGFYLPARNPAVFEFKKDRAEYWIKQGAAPTDTVARLFSKNGLKGLEKFMQRYAKQKSKSAPEEAPPAPKAEVPAPQAEAPKQEEAPAEATASETGDKQ